MYTYSSGSFSFHGNQKNQTVSPFFYIPLKQSFLALRVEHLRLLDLKSGANYLFCTQNTVEGSDLLLSNDYDRYAAWGVGSAASKFKSRKLNLCGLAMKHLPHCMIENKISAEHFISRERRYSHFTKSAIVSSVAMTGCPKLTPIYFSIFAFDVIQ